MNKSIKSAVILALAMASAVSHAQTTYIGGSFGMVDYSESGVEDASFTAVFGRLGTFFNPNFSGELRAGFGLGDDTVTVMGTDVDVELNSLYGVFLRGGIEANDVFYPYIALGYTRGEIKASAQGFSASESESDMSFGIGTDLTFNDGLTANIEYMNYFDKDGAEISGFSVGFSKSF